MFNRCQNDYDIIVVGGGHAGVEAAITCTKLGMKTLLLCLNFKMVANMPCNPHIGGSAKGIVVREIDALGGCLGRFADCEGSLLQIKELNTSKGPGVRCLRAQEDKKQYPRNVQKYLLTLSDLDIYESEVKSLLIENKAIKGVVLENGKTINCRCCILCCGTHLESRILRGHVIKDEGPDGEKSAHGLSKSLLDNGVKLMRLKTGTPPRLKRDSIDFSSLQVEEGENLDYSFSFDSTSFLKKEDMIVCHLAYSNPTTHNIIREHLKDSAMYGGVVEGVGPRYCPSIEDKVVRFKDKNRHQLFLEPESKETDSIYLDGFSTSMPIEVQEEMVHSIKGLEKARFLKYAYAIEYDAIAPLQIDYSLMLRDIDGLFIAGQLAGTSGYEEAAALGLMAAINACKKLKNEPPLILKREQAYIGIMIDDIVSKGSKEPYRLLSSRSEYRLLTRSDNADTRLLKIGYDIGLNSEQRYNRLKKADENVHRAISQLESIKVGSNQNVRDYLSSVGYNSVNGADTLKDCLKKQNVTYCGLKECYSSLYDLNKIEEKKCETEVKYQGYIALQQKEADRRLSYQDLILPDSLNYLSMSGISNEAKEKLNLLRPKTLGEASQISNVHPSDIDVLSFYVRHSDK